MTQAGRRRRGPDQGHRDAATHGDGSTAPTDVEALAALRTIAAWLGVGSAPATVYTQHRLPPDVASRDAYERRHRSLRRAGVQGVWTRGKTLACTADAWATELPRESRPKLSIVATPSASDAIDAVLGIKTRPR